MNQRDNFSAVTRRILALRVGHLCSNPDCRAPTSGPSEQSGAGVINLGVAAHITAASPGGPRFDVDLTPEKRAAVENGI